MKLKCVFSFFQAYERFSGDMLNNDDDEYLDLPLLDERALLDEYKKLLQN